MTGEELVVTRSSAVPVLRTLIVAPVTRTVRHIPTEIGLDQEHGLAVSCAASFDNLLRVRRSHLTERLGSLGSGKYRRDLPGTRRAGRLLSSSVLGTARG